jgi:predicted nucleotidyltransferase
MPIEKFCYYIWPEFDGLASYAWMATLPNSGGVGPCVGSADQWNGRHPISSQLCSEFGKWAIEFENTVLSSPDEEPNIDWDYFHNRGIILAKRLKSELGPECRVYYVKPHEEPDCDRRFQVIKEDGSMEEIVPVIDAIQDHLADIEEKNNVRILYAVESGSRAWGFASRNSDFDVRFIYIHKPDWYLSIREKRDVIEIPINADLDISGWDLRKALGLLRKTNPPLLEWLGSPIVYQDRFGLADKMHQVVASNFSPRRCMLHYLHMAKGNFREYLKADTVRVKKYFYVLRPVLGCLWIERHNTMPPTEFDRLYLDADLSPTLKHEIDNLLQRKIAGGELDMEPRIEVINEFLEEQIEHFASIANDLESPEPDVDALDDLFREMLQTVWKTE